MTQVDTVAQLSHISQDECHNTHLDGRTHYKLAPERPFTAEQRPYTTILFGTLSRFHDTFIEAVFRGAGFLCQKLPTPVRRAHETGKEFCNNGLCNPNYFTAGNLIEFLRAREREGMTRTEVCDRFIYFTAGGCGPCRFGMYEAEYRQALANAGYPGFRIITFDSNQVIQKGSEQPGLKFTVDLGVDMINALNFGDALFELSYQIRPYEVHAGETDAVLDDCVRDVADFLRTRRHIEVMEDGPWWLVDMLKDMPRMQRTAKILGKIWWDLHAADAVALHERIRARLDSIEIDPLRAKPIVKITGEFFSAIAEGDANYSMFRFLEQEGAETSLDPIASLILYWLNQARMNNRRRRGVISTQGQYWRKELLFGFCDWFWTRYYHRTTRLLGGTAHPLAKQKELEGLAAPYYNPLARGGEGHLEVAKTLYYSGKRACHLVLSLKPFGCMPSTQSDGVMAGVIARNPDVHFIAIETSGEGEANAHSRVQMALGDARRRCRVEFDAALAATGLSLDEARSYVAAHRELRSSLYTYSKRPGVTGRAAQMVYHLAERVR